MNRLCEMEGEVMPKQLKYRYGLEYKNHIENALLQNKEQFQYAIDISSDRQDSPATQELFKKLMSIVTLKMDRKILKTKKPHLIPQEKRTQVVMVPESMSKGTRKACISHLHGFLSLPADVPLTPFEEMKHMTQFRFWVHVYAYKLGLVRKRNRRNHRDLYEVNLDNNKEDNMREGKVGYATALQDYDRHVGNVIHYGNIFSPLH